MTKIQKIARKLYWAFYWPGTPQGRDYWEDVHKNLCTMGGVDSFHAEWRSTKNYATPDDPKYYKRIRNLAMSLATAFCWDDVPLGRNYWVEVCDNLFTLSKPPQVSGKIKAGDDCLVWDDGRPSIDQISIRNIVTTDNYTFEYVDSLGKCWKHAKKLSPELLESLKKEVGK